MLEPGEAWGRRLWGWPPKEEEPAAIVTSSFQRLQAQSIEFARSAMVDEWGKLLRRYDWDWIGHLTFGRSTHDEAAHKRFRQWTHALNRERYSHTYYKHGDGMRIARAKEYTRSRGIIHYHILMMDTGSLPISVATNLWNEPAGDCMIEAYDPSKGGAFYIAKRYASADGGEIDFFGEWDEEGRRRLEALALRRSLLN